MRRFECTFTPFEFRMKKTQMILRLGLRHFPAFTRRFLANTIQISVGELTVKIPVDDDAGLRIVYWQKTWKSEVIKRLAGLKPGTFLDIGANVGETLLDLRHAHPSIAYVGFEPSSACVTYLRRLLKVNAFQHSSIVPIGLADKASIFSLHAGQGVDYDGTATILESYRPGRIFDIEHVPCYAYDEICAGLAINAICFVKIDVEGAELEVIHGMQQSLRTSTPVVLCEVLFTDPKGDLAAAAERNGRLMQLLSNMQYEVWQLQKSADDAEIVGAVHVSQFANAYYSGENRDLCDYLFVPIASSSATRKALLG